jgi:hypothetical protein
VSLLYLDEYELGSKAQNLVKIEVGNEHDEYDNIGFPDSSMIEAVKNKPLLKVFDITNISKLRHKIELKDSVKLETFKALGSNITGASFAEGVNLRYLYLPKTITSIDLNQAFKLNRII